MSFNADIALGALLVSTWACSVLYTVEVIQAAHYYRYFKHDSWTLKLLVSSAIAMDSVSMIANYASVYLYTITHWGVSFHFIYHSLTQFAFLRRFGVCAEPVLGKSFWSYWKKHNRTHVIEQFETLYLVATGVVTALVQSFLAGRYWLLTRSKFITIALFFFITVAAGGAFACGVTLAIFPEYKNRRKVTIPAFFWLITEAVTDISIASALLWEFRKAESPFKETRSLLNRLVAQTIQTGTSGASVALAVLVTFLANPESNVPTGIAYLLGRVYCITLLANLNSRKAGKMWSGVIMSSGANLETRGESGKQERGEGDDEYGSIHVHRTALVHIDTPPELSIGSFKINPGQGLPDDNPAVEIEMTVNDSASYSAKKKQDLFAA
ncbi:hypothetical protein C8J57DRAFT_1538114 [Mycena rebaudengoi]|nr:hypothetical protein C8J57DRAFT_1538114 [Mycena rebaudengoi]